MNVKVLFFSARLHLGSLLLTIIVLSILPAPAQTLSAINYNQGYEDVTDLEDLGYQWNTLDPGDTIRVQISSDFSYTGENSLVIESYAFTSTTFLIIPLNLGFNDNIYFSMYFYSFGYRISTIRIVFSDAFDQPLLLDYSGSGTFWVSDFVFNMGLVLPENEWTQISLDLGADIEFAVNSEGSPYSNGYIPTKISFLQIFQSIDDGLYVNFFDDLMFADTSIAKIEFNGNDDLTKYRNIGKVDPLSHGLMDPEQQTSENAIATHITELGFPFDGLKLRLLIGISMVIAISVVYLLRRRK